MNGASATPDSLPLSQLMLYGLLALPVAVISLPIYIHIPQFYGETLGMDLAVLGVVLLVARLFDTVQDPLLGYASDRLHQRGYSRQKLMGLGLVPLVLGLLMLVHPPADLMFVWLILSLLILYSAFSFVAINYYSYGAEWSADATHQSTISGWREVCVLLGILLASVLPQALVNQLGEEAGYAAFGYVLSGLILVIGLVCLCGLRAPARHVKRESLSLKASLMKLKNSRPYAWLLSVFFLNGIANSIPATLVLFYVSDVLELADQSGYFLGLYFLAGLLGMPLWLKLAKCLGKKRCLMLSMVLASISFIWAFTLSPGDATAFYIICLLSGACLGADMAMPPAMLGDVVHQEGGDDAGSYFGVWNLVWKLTFAIAAGITLPLLAMMGYDPSAGTVSEDGRTMLAMMYALVPSCIKLVSTVLLYLSPLEARTSSSETKGKCFIRL